MNTKYKSIIDFFSKRLKVWITSEELAEKFNVTSRTIRNRIAKINESYPNLIDSSNSGYTITSDRYTMFTKFSKGLDEGEQPRESLILLELLKHSNNGVDLFDLSEKLYISESTLKSDLQTMKKTLPIGKLSIVTRNNIISLEGDEKYKRQYMVSLLYSESDMYKDLSKTIQKMIGYISLDTLRETIKSVLNKYDIDVNQYALDNIAMHFAVSVERINQGYVLSEENQELEVSINLDREYNIVEFIINELSKQYQISFPAIEKHSLSLQFVGLKNQAISSENQTNLEEYIDKDIIRTLKKVLHQAELMYLVDFEDDEFFNKLVIHLQSLFYRSKIKTYTRNSSIMELKINYPIIYDISIFLSSLIQDELSIVFNEDEIAFIALHVGALLERQKDNERKIQLLLYADNYHDIANILKENILKHLEDRVTIAIVKTLKELSDEDYDLLVTTKREVATQYDNSILVKPFLTKRDVTVLRNRVEMKEKARTKETYRLLIDCYFSPNLFFNKLDTTEMEVSNIMWRMIDELAGHGYVDEAFEKNIQKREGMSPTSFPSGIAVPHSIELDAKKSGISILTLQEPVKWAQYEVTMVAMIAINKNEAQTFNQLFEVFTEIASVPLNVDRLSTTENFEEFSMLLKLMVDELV